MTPPRDTLPKLCGADVELGNFILGGGPDGGARLAARALLAAIPAPYARRHDAHGGIESADPQDRGRKFLASNGGCFYIDLDHLECCLPEVVSAWDHVAAWHATLRIAARALADANAAMPPGQTIHLLANNTDGRHAYGSHLSFLVTRRTFDDVFERRMHYLLFLASFLAASVVVTGAGKVGAENGRPPVAYALSQRADYLETVVGSQTTHRRPIVNSRDEPLCGIAPRDASTTGPPGATHARLHVIAYDNSLCHGSALLKVGTMQLVLGLLESGRVDARLLLDDPIAALHRWSHDPTFRARARTVSGRRLTALELQLGFLAEARRHADAGGYDGVVPRAAELLTFWEDTLIRLRRGDLTSLVGRLDWALKRHILEQAMAQRPGLAWTDPMLRYLDQLYASLDPARGLYWAYERAGIVERVVGEDAVAHFVDTPPADTRAWGRAMLLRLAGRRVQDVDWDYLRVWDHGRGSWPRLRTIHLDDPLGSTRDTLAPLIDAADSVDDVLSALARPAAFPSVPPEPPLAGAPNPQRRPDHELP